MTLTFASPVAARRAGGPWVYLGKDARLREGLEAKLGPRAPLGGAVRAEAERLRRPFLDLVASLGKACPDPEAWWAGTLAWKDSEASDLFLLCCYQALCLRWARSPARERPALAVVEDAWLLESLRGALGANPETRVEGRTGLEGRRAAWAALGGARRLRWAARTLAAMLRQRRHASAPRPDDDAPAVAVYSHLLERSLASPGRWTDPFLPGLDDELEAAGIPVRRFAYTGAFGFEERLARLEPRVLPTLRFARAADVWRALAAKVPAAPAGARLDGAPVGLLLERERWWDLSRAGRPACLLFRACVARLLASRAWKAVVFPWENQPQERMLVLAARAAGVRTVGYQHTTLPRLQLSFFPGAGEAAEAPLPDVLVASGPYALELLRREGYPAERLVLGGSRRYPRWSPAPPPDPAAASRPEVLVLLPLEREPSEHLLAALRRSGCRARVKSHPSAPPPALGGALAAEPPAASFAESLSRCGPVVFCGSTTGLEALRAGHPVLRFQPESLVPVDPADFLSDRELPTASDAELRERLDGLAAAPAARARLDALFSPVDPAAWRKALA
ncbi:MAG: hypothetical protein HY554_14000 [Elusimicrobia bacterium]|nr:hypothetical protein [Elusimicrobiota bacterium]